MLILVFQVMLGGVAVGPGINGMPVQSAQFRLDIGSGEEKLNGMFIFLI